jgi:hypothetical protein
MVRREPVPALPKSSGPSGCSRQPLPVPWMIHSSPFLFDLRAHRPHGLAGAHDVLAFEQAGDAGFALARPPNMKERCEIDLSPGTAGSGRAGGGLVRHGSNGSLIDTWMKCEAGSNTGF